MSMTTEVVAVARQEFELLGKLAYRHGLGDRHRIPGALGLELDLAVPRLRLVLLALRPALLLVAVYLFLPTGGPSLA